MSRVQFVCAVLVLCSIVDATRLDDYVWRPDPNYSWVDMGPAYVLHGKSPLGTKTWTGYTLNMTSQGWLTDADFANNSDAKSIWYVVTMAHCNTGPPRKRKKAQNSIADIRKCAKMPENAVTRLQHVFFYL